VRRGEGDDRVWVKKRARNEALDCRIYALGGLYILNPNLKVISEKMAERTEEEDVTKEEQEKRERERKIKNTRRLGGFVRNW